MQGLVAVAGPLLVDQSTAQLADDRDVGRLGVTSVGIRGVARTAAIVASLLSWAVGRVGGRMPASGSSPELPCSSSRTPWVGVVVLRLVHATTSQWRWRRWWASARRTTTQRAWVGERLAEWAGATAWAAATTPE